MSRNHSCCFVYTLAAHVHRHVRTTFCRPQIRALLCRPAVGRDQDQQQRPLPAPSDHPQRAELWPARRLSAVSEGLPGHAVGLRVRCLVSDDTVMTPWWDREERRGEEVMPVVVLLYSVVVSCLQNVCCILYTCTCMTVTVQLYGYVYMTVCLYDCITMTLRL